MINGSTPLHLAAQDSDRGDQEGRILAIKMLLETGAAPDIADSSGKLPFEYSTNPDVREMLGGPAEEAVSEKMWRQYLNRNRFACGIDNSIPSYNTCAAVISGSSSGEANPAC